MDNSSSSSEEESWAYKRRRQDLQQDSDESESDQWLIVDEVGDDVESSEEDTGYQDPLSVTIEIQGRGHSNQASISHAYNSSESMQVFRDCIPDREDNTLHWIGVKGPTESYVKMMMEREDKRKVILSSSLAPMQEEEELDCFMYGNEPLFNVISKSLPNDAPKPSSQGLKRKRSTKDRDQRPVYGPTIGSESVHSFFSSRGLIKCPICHEVSQDMRKHAIKEHFPFFWMPHTSCWKCGSYHHNKENLVEHFKNKHKGQEIYRFTEENIPHYLQFAFSYITRLCTAIRVPEENLLQFIQDNNLVASPGRSVHSLQRGLVTMAACMYEGQEVSIEDINIHPPNRPTDILLSWETLLGLLTYVDQDQQNELKTSTEKAGPKGAIFHGQIVSSEYVDSHCHLPETFVRWGVNNMTSLERVSTPYADSQHSMEFCVWSACWPDTNWQQIPTSKNAVAEFSEKCFISVSVHPGAVSSRILWDPSYRTKETRDKITFSELVESPKCVAVGEAGLDYGYGKIATQKICLKQQMLLARKHSKPFVIHSRPKVDNEEEIEKVLREVLKMAKDTLTSDHFLLWHCFMGNMPFVIEACKSFPNSYFSLSPKSFNFRKFPYLDRTIRSITADKIVFETDSPYLGAPPDIDDGSPFLIPNVIKLYEKLTGWPATIVMRVASHNSRTFYGLK